MLNSPPVAIWKITRTYHVKANDKTHALRKLKQAIEQGYDYKYLTSQRVVEQVVEDVENKKSKHPWLKEIKRQLTGKK